MVSLMRRLGVSVEVNARVRNVCGASTCVRPLVLVLTLAGVVGSETACRWGQTRARLPDRLSDADYWTLVTSLSEPPGAFEHSDNLVSNEPMFVHTVPLLRPRGGVYIGVGPEQNFSYIARLRPAMAFILDIRQENRNLHLLYKALFEMSGDRAAFVSRLFSRERPPALDDDASVQEIFNAFAGVAPSPALHDDTRRVVRDRLIDVHRWPLSPDDLGSIDYALDAFRLYGPDIHYGSSRPESEAGPTYRALMTALDVRAQSRSYLASERTFNVVKNLQVLNLIVPAVGDFGAAIAIGRVGKYVRERGSLVTAFYGSNVEIYLSKQKTAVFCDSLAALPSDDQSDFIAGNGVRPLAAKLRMCAGGR